MINKIIKKQVGIKLLQSTKKNLEGDFFVTLTSITVHLGSCRTKLSHVRYWTFMWCRDPQLSIPQLFSRLDYSNCIDCSTGVFSLKCALY